MTDIEVKNQIDLEVASNMRAMTEPMKELFLKAVERGRIIGAEQREDRDRDSMVPLLDLVHKLHEEIRDLKANHQWQPLPPNPTEGGDE